MNVSMGISMFYRAYSSRVVGSVWWFATTLLVAYYTANLAAFLTFERVALPFSTAEELANSSSITYSCLRDGSTRNFFKALLVLFT